jgi:hypothetical protein
MRTPRLRRAVRLFKDQLAKDRSSAVVCKVMYSLDSILADAQECGLPRSAPVAELSPTAAHCCVKCNRNGNWPGRYCSPECWKLDYYAPENAPPKKKPAIAPRKERQHKYQPRPKRNCTNPNCGKLVEFRRFCSIDCLEQAKRMSGRMSERIRKIRQQTALQVLRNLGFGDAIINERNRQKRERIALQILRELGFTNTMIDDPATKPLHEDAAIRRADNQ